MRRALAALTALLLIGCAKRATEDLTRPVPPAKPEVANDATLAMWRSTFEQQTTQWREVFKSEASPLPESKRATFEGPDFSPYDPQWRLVGDLQRIRPQRWIEVPSTHGKTQTYLEYGRFPVAADSDTVALVVYRPLEHPEQFFIPFHDATNGEETYGGGRYVHLDSLDVHRWVLDFNKAYNPYCAYDSVWICPLPPPSNTLPLPVRAGMKAPKGHA